VEECFTFGHQALDLAERLQTPVFVLSDLDLGMNHWMSRPFQYPDRPMDRGKVLSAEELGRRGGFARYRDVDGDGVGWRTLPGTAHPRAGYFTRGSGHDDAAAYSEQPDVYRRNLERLARKIDGARALLPAPVEERAPGARIGLVAYGSSDPAVRESRAELGAGHGLPTGYLRVRGWPFAEAVAGFVAAHERVYVVEQNRDGQLASLLRLDLEGRLAARIHPLAWSDGLPLDARSVTEAVLRAEAAHHVDGPEEEEDGLVGGPLHGTEVHA